jgi:hypothetical protein
MIKEFKFFTGELKIYNYDRQHVVWRNGQGRQIPIFYMTNNHIIATLGCLRGVGLTEIPDPYFNRTKREWILIFESEIRYRENENRV